MPRLIQQLGLKCPKVDSVHVVKITHRVANTIFTINTTTTISFEY